MISLHDTCTCICSHSPLNWFMAIKHTLAVGFRIQITVKVSFARKVRMHANWFYRKGEAYFFKLINMYTCWFYDFYYLFIDELLARRNTSVVVIWKHTMVSAGLALFGVGVGISNIVAGADSDDGRWHLSGGSLVPAILVSVSNVFNTYGQLSVSTKLLFCCT